MSETPVPMRREDVPDELIQLMADAEYDAPGGCSAWDSYRTVLAAVLPAARRRWFREQYGDPIARRSEPLHPDDPAEILMRIRPDCVVVSRADLETKLNQRNNHGHLRPGIWDDSNAPEIAGKPCVECAAEKRLREALEDQP